MDFNKMKRENRIRVLLLKKYLAFSMAQMERDEYIILTILVKMELCDPAFRPHLKTKPKNKTTATHERNFPKKKDKRWVGI